MGTGGCLLEGKRVIVAIDLQVDEPLRIHMGVSKIAIDLQVDEPLRIHMGVSKNRSTPKWMVYDGKPY